MSAPGFLALLRRLERDRPDRPRIGRSARLSEEIADLGQDPELAFPDAEFREVDAARPDRHGRTRLRTRVMGPFGAFGPLPLTTTEEAQRWQADGQGGFVGFADIFSARFLQLFFRAWSDSHAITQHDRPAEDRFAGYVAAVSGTGTPAFRNHDEFPDLARLPLVPVFGGRVRSAARLRQMLALHFGFEVTVEEHVPSWLVFEPDELHGLGQGGALGQNSYLGSRVASVSDRICIHLTLPDVDRYRGFLPGGSDNRMLSHLVFWYLGRVLDVDVALRLPPDQIPAAQIGKTTSLGWLAAVAPTGRAGDPPVEVARFRIDPETRRSKDAA